MTAPCRVVLVQQAVADGHGSVRVGIAVDVEDQDISGLTAVVACVGIIHATSLFINICSASFVGVQHKLRKEVRL